MNLLSIVYIGNVIVAGWISISSLFFTNYAATGVFQDAYPPSDVMRLVGCLWFSIFVISAFGLFFNPLAFSVILLVQLIYKSMWLILVWFPAYKERQRYPVGMAVFFLVWVVVLPFAIPWSYLFGKEYAF